MLGATTGSLDGTLHNTSNGSVNFATNDNQTHYLFAPDLSPSLFTAGLEIPPLRPQLADSSLTTVDTTIVAPPNGRLRSRPKARRNPGQTLNVTIDGDNYQTDATSSFGAGTNVTQTSFNSPTSLTATVAVAANATLGARDVTVSNPDGGNATLTARLHDRSPAPHPPILDPALRGQAA